MKISQLFLSITLLMVVVKLPAQSPYDFCESAYEISSPKKWCSKTGQFATFDATHSGSDMATCFANFGKDIWFKFVAEGSVLKITVKGIGKGRKVLKQPEFVLFAGDCVNQISLIGCARSRPGRKFVSLRKNDLIPGQTYLISVQDAQQDAGEFQICLRNYSPKVITQNKSKKSRVPQLNAAIKEGMEFSIKNLRFDANSYKIKSSFLPTLFEIVKYLKANPTVIIEVGGHTNSNCDDIYCQELSHNRAKAIASFIIKKKVDSNQIQYRGYGKTKPLTNNHSAANQTKNQRVAIKVIKTK